MTNGNLMALLTLMKSQPLAYNKDNQEDKEPVFDSVDTLEATLVIYADMIKNIKVNKEKMMAAAGDGFSTATDLADYLVKKGMPFRTSHEVVAELVNFAIKNKLDLHEITLDTFKHYSKLIDKDIYDVITVEGSVQARNHVGGTNTQTVANAIKLAEQSLSKKGS
jgi:argininosuccinate lyase